MKLSRRKKAALVLAGVAVTGVGAVLALLWRGIPLPAPTGPYPVGRTSFHLVDSSRPEVFTEDANDFRELMISVHYPADPVALTRRAPYADPALAAGIAKVYDTPRFAIEVGGSHAWERPAMAAQEGGFPIVIFSPGFGEPPLFYTATLEDLASHGFVVVGVSHPYSNGITVFPDGRIALQNEAGSQPDVSLYRPDDPAVAALAKYHDVGAVWVEDVRFVLDELTRINRDDGLFAGRLNLSKVGIFGHSFGGAAAARTVQIDARFLAGINMDGTDFRATFDADIPRPVMWMNSPRKFSDADLASGGKTRAWADKAERGQRRFDGLLERTADGRRAVIQGATHMTFISDFAIIGSMVPWSWLLRGMDLGSIPGPRAVSLVDAFVIEFFQKHLQGQLAPLLDGPSDRFPEVQLQRRKQ
jgi:predicted dienelactone hydrolase